MTYHRSFSRSALFAFVLACSVSLAFAQTGHVLNGVGPVDQGFSGAGMAFPQDAMTALHTNPASIATFSGSEWDVSLQMLFSSTDLQSTLNPNVMGPGNPPVTLSGSSSSSAGPFPIPATGFVYSPETTRWAFGVSAFGVGGFGVDYEVGDPMTPGGNPITFPQAMGGFGAINSTFALFQVAPTVAYRLTENLSVGVAPTLNVGLLEVNPFPATSPTPQGYPEGPQTSALGIGVQGGIHLSNLNGFHAGVSLKSPQVFQDYEFSPNGQAYSFNMDYPMIASVALAYTGLDRFAFLADARYIDFANTDGFETAGFDATGAVTGFGWNSITVVALGVQYEVTERLPVRVGYAYNQSPIDDDVAFYNVASPALVEHHLSGGLSYTINDRFRVSTAVQYAPRNSVECPLQNPQMLTFQDSASVPGTHMKTSLSTVTVIAGFSMQF